MDYEQKYKEALELARDYYKANSKLNKADENVILKYIFPELAESEDEKTRKALISFLKSPFVNENITDEKVAPWLAWLEKQGTSYTKRDVDDAYFEGMAFAKDELEKQRPTWSEEDEVRIKQICEDLKCGLENFHSSKNVKGLHFEEIIKSNIDWLKSLKERIGG